MEFLRLRKLTFALFTLAGTLLAGPELHAQQLLDPASQPRFVNPLTAPSVINATAPGQTLNMSITQFEKDLGLKVPGTLDPIPNTKVWGYNNEYPGPTILARKDVPLNVYWLNNLKDGSGPLPHLLSSALDLSVHTAYMDATPPNSGSIGVPIVTHLHGGHTESESDGLPDAWFTPDFAQKGPGFIKGEVLPYHYTNDQEAATIWYHDHALGITRLNVYAGLAGFYLLNDQLEDDLRAAKKLPHPNHDFGLAIQDRMFEENGQLHYPAMPEVPGAPNPSVLPEFFGNTILVNGQAWPYLEVEPRQYRFRLLNGSDSRFYNLFFSEPVKFWQIASDQGFLPAPVGSDQLLLATGERKEVIIDFSNPALWGKTIIMRNNAKAPFPKGEAPNPQNEGQIMAFKVVKPLHNPNNMYPLTPVPASLRAPLPIPNTSLPARKLILFEGTDGYGRLEAKLGTFEDGALSYHDDITELITQNNTEIWEIYNLTMDAHPIHLHQVHFQVLNTQKFRAQYAGHEDEEIGKMSNAQLIGQPKLPEMGQRGYKDTYAVEPGEVARFIAKFDLVGEYVWHCHILSHEDHDMMRKFEVIAPNGSRTAAEGIAANVKLSAENSYRLFPNPFTTVTDLHYKTTEAGNVTVGVYDLKGRLVKEVFNGHVGAGEHQQQIEAREISSGLYICEIQLNGKTHRERLVVAK